MRKILILFVIMILGMAVTAYAGKLDAPHLAAKLVCGDCHTPQYGDFPNDEPCLGCHINVTGGGYTKTNAPFVKTHSSANTSSTYGTWSFLCKDCHNPHAQNQQEAYGSATYLATTRITSIAPNYAGNTTVFGYDTLSIMRSEWSDTTKWGQKTGNERGLIFYDTNNTSRISYEIVSVDTNAKTITVTGAITGPLVGDTFAVLYGQMIQSVVNTPSGGVAAKFFSNTGPNSFAYNESGTGTDPQVDGVCQVCHTKTNHWRRNGTLADHNSGLNCTQCHRHPEGFKPSCDNCHGYPPAPLASPSTGSTTAGAHVTHAVTKRFECSICHYNSVGMGTTHNDTKVTMGFVDILGPATSTGGKYDGQTTVTYETTDSGTTVSKSGTKTCTNIYCHSVVQSSGGGALTLNNTSQYKSPVWNGTVQCGSCHKGDGVQGDASLMDSGSHTKHVAAPYSKACSECHNGFGSGSAQHINFNIDMAFSSDPFGNTGAYSQSPNPPTNGYGSCSNVYCHSTAQGDGGTPLISGSAAFSTPTWASGALSCSGCHQAPPASGAHSIHATSYNFACDACHYGSVPPASTTHVNKVINVNINSAYGTGATYSLGSHAPGIGYGNCSNTYCHSNGTSVSTGTVPANASPVWSGSTTCGSCHGGGNSTGQPNYANGSPKANSHAKHPTDCSLCHSATTTDGTTISNKSNHANKQYNLLAKAPTTFTYTYNANGGSCSNISCHFSNGTPVVWGSTISCGGCHPAPPTSAAHTTHAGALTSGTAQYGNDGVSSTASAYGFNCGNCHPLDTAKHGNGVVEVELYNSLASGFKAKNSATASKTGSGDTTVCNGVYCHSDGTQKGTPVYAATPQWGGTFAGDRCAGCHGNSPTGTSAHAAHVVGIHYDTIYTGTSGLKTAGTSNTSSHGLATTSTTLNCNICHNKTVTLSSNDKNTVCAGCHNGTTATLRGDASIADKSYHVNGTRDISFASGILSNAQIRNDITTVTELNTSWTRANGYKAAGSVDQAVSPPSFNAQTMTCSAVACHNGRAVSWDQTNVSCKSCHTSLSN